MNQKGRLLDEMAVPTFAKSHHLSCHDSVISKTGKELLQQNFLKNIFPSLSEGPVSRGSNQDAHSDIISSLKKIKGLESEDVLTVSSHFTKLDNSTTSLNEMSKQLLNSHVIRGFAFPSRDVFAHVINDAKSSDSTRRMYPLPQTPQLLAANALNSDLLLFYDHGLYHEQLQKDLLKLAAPADDTDTRSRIKKSKSSHPSLSRISFPRQKDITKKVKRNIEHILARKDQGIETLREYTKSKDYVVRKISLVKLNKIKTVTDSLKGTEAYDLKKNQRDMPVAYNCFICEASSKSHDDQNMVFHDTVLANVNVHRLLPLDTVDDVKNHFKIKHSCQATLPTKEKMKCSDKEYLALKLDRQQMKSLPQSESRHSYVLTCLFCRGSKTVDKGCSLFCCLRCGRDHLYAYHKESDIFQMVKEELQRRWVQNSFHLDIINQVRVWWEGEGEFDDKKKMVMNFYIFHLISFLLTIYYFKK